ncbi:MAG TPA: hypothetical protein VMW10_03140 [Alphaproteobacteria bacterium]|nr:hypothetical protein [Alphaproteobacteria bacterium]
MKNEALIFMLAIAGLIGAGQAADAIQFNCPDLHATTYHQGTGNNSYIFVGDIINPLLSSLSIKTKISTLDETVKLKWKGKHVFYGVRSDNPDNPDFPSYKLDSVKFIGANLFSPPGRLTDIPECIYEWQFTGLLFPGGAKSIQESVMTDSVHDCSLEGSTFTCPTPAS